MTRRTFAGNPGSAPLVEPNDARVEDLRGLAAPGGPLLELTGTQTARIEAACPRDRIRKADR